MWDGKNVQVGNLYGIVVRVDHIQGRYDVHQGFAGSGFALKQIFYKYSEYLKSERSVWETKPKMVGFSAHSNFRCSGCSVCLVHWI